MSCINCGQTFKALQGVLGKTDDTKNRALVYLMYKTDPELPNTYGRKAREGTVLDLFSQSFLGEFG